MYQEIFCIITDVLISRDVPHICKTMEVFIVRAFIRVLFPYSICNIPYYLYLISPFRNVEPDLWPRGGLCLAHELIK